ncbi:MAG TPA: hypothetical protein VHS09_00815 [Polyangiaceae bacterium]|nr:hypothetical protein [Polyangiaceae bacterium]
MKFKRTPLPDGGEMVEIAARLRSPVLDEAAEQWAAVKDVRARIGTLTAELQRMSDSLGDTYYRNAVIIRTVHQLEKVLTMGHEVAQAELAVRLVKQAVDEARAKGWTPEEAADDMIARSAAARDGLIPFAAKLPAARGEIVRAIAAASRVGRPRKTGARRRRTADVDTAAGTKLALLRKLGLSRKDLSSLRMGKLRRKPRHTTR